MTSKISRHGLMKNISGSEAFGIQKKKSRRGLAQISVLHHKSLVAEQYRTIRTNIEFSSVQTHLRSILVTSSVPGEGKSFSAANLAAVFAQQEKGAARRCGFTKTDDTRDLSA